MKKIVLIICAGCVVFLGATFPAFARSAKTQHPVYLVHGVLGWDQAFDLGSYYFGDDLGTSVADTCSFLELFCNRHIDKHQQVHIVQLTSLESTLYRGKELYDILNAYVEDEGLRILGSAGYGLNESELHQAIAGLSNRPHVHLIGHSQGGIDSRYAAYLLAQEYGYNVAKVVVTVSSPHRGSGIAQSMLALKDGNWLQRGIYGSLLFMFEELWSGILANGNVDGKTQNAVNMMTSMGYYDIIPEDDQATGMKLFNEQFPLHDGANYLNADKYVSFVTAEKRSHQSWAMQALVAIGGDIDGNVYEMDPENTPVELRKIDQTNTTDTADLRDDDGFIPLYSQQAGFRMRYTNRAFGDDLVEEIPEFGEVTDVNHPTPAQMGKPAENAGELDGMDGVLDVGHFEEVTLPLGFLLTNANGGIEFDELGYYSAMIDYIARNE